MKTHIASTEKLMPTIPYSRASVVSATQRISTVFNDDIGNFRSGTGTGFWVMSDRELPYYVTNRHNIDPKAHKTLGENYTLFSAAIAIRAYNTNTKLPDGGVHDLKIDLDASKWFYPKDNSDVAVLQPGNWVRPHGEGMILAGIPLKYLTQPEPVEIMDSLFFVGFPGHRRSGAAYDFPIARSCTIASIPQFDYSMEDTTIQTPNTCLVGGLSFAGSSGSPVFMEKNGKTELLGIMSGHLPPDVNGSDWAARHSGLSYLTIGSVIAQIFSDNNL